MEMAATVSAPRLSFPHFVTVDLGRAGKLSRTVALAVIKGTEQSPRKDSPAHLAWESTELQ
jgi:hypothetical protein